MRLLIAFFTIFCTLQSSFAQDSCACCTQSHEQFDFWLGDWNVYDTLGNLVGENTIESLVSDCILSEYWRGRSGSVGRSYNYFDPMDSTWNQIWIDNSGSNLVLKGGLVGSKMVLMSKFVSGQNIDWYKNRVTWTPNPDGSVIQQWEILDKKGQVINQIFKGIYKKK